jgi:DNA processing protein
VEETRLARVALSWLVEPGSLALWARVADYGPVAVLDGLLATGLDHHLREAAGARLGTAPPRELAAVALERAARLGARVVIPEDDEWPDRLDQLAGICAAGGSDPVERDGAPPLCLWVRGAGCLDDVLERSVAVVGARAATGYGAHVARQIGYGLAERDWTVVSGGAFGVDAYAHRGALAAGGTTVAVLACGVDRPYPLAHANLFDRIAEDGLLVSEWPLGADPFRHRFLIRNRVIAAATCGTVMVEAAARSGARQTLRRAGQLGRCRMVVPGAVTSAMSVGCHEELRDPEVRLVTGVPHILEDVGRFGADLAPVPRGPDHPRDGLEPTERRLLEALLIRKPLPPEAVAARAGVAVRDALRILPGLAFRGLARRNPDGFVVVRSPDRPPGPGPDAGAGGAAA